MSGRRSTSSGSDQIHVGVLRIVLTIPGAHSLKDRRQAVHSVRDRVRHRFEVTFNEVGGGDDPQRQTVVITTAGNDGRKIRSILDSCLGVVHEHPVVVAGEVDVDVFRWHPSGEDWAARMTAELVSPDETVWDPQPAPPARSVREPVVRFDPEDGLVTEEPDE